MTKRNPGLPRNPRDLYQTRDVRAVLPLLAHLPEGARFHEPCAGEGDLVDWLERFGHRCVGAGDIAPGRPGIEARDALTLDACAGDFFITNPPWSRDLLHGIADHLRRIAPTWILADADWWQTDQTRLAARAGVPTVAELMAHCRRMVAVGRVGWMETGGQGYDNAAWYLFTARPGPMIAYPQGCRDVLPALSLARSGSQAGGGRSDLDGGDDQLAAEGGERVLEAADLRRVAGVEHAADLALGDAEGAGEIRLLDALGPHGVVERRLGGDQGARRGLGAASAPGRCGGGVGDILARQHATGDRLLEAVARGGRRAHLLGDAGDRLGQVREGDGDAVLGGFDGVGVEKAHRLVSSEVLGVDPELLAHGAEGAGRQFARLHDGPAPAVGERLVPALAARAVERDRGAGPAPQLANLADEFLAVHGENIAQKCAIRKRKIAHFCALPRITAGGWA
jgi:hypothetical protein